MSKTSKILVSIVLVIFSLLLLYQFLFISIEIYNAYLMGNLGLVYLVLVFYPVSILISYILVKYFSFNDRFYLGLIVAISFGYLIYTEFIIK